MEDPSYKNQKPVAVALNLNSNSHDDNIYVSIV